jgi:hypothetical protein
MNTGEFGAPPLACDDWEESVAAAPGEDWPAFQGDNSNMDPPLVFTNFVQMFSGDSFDMIEEAPAQSGHFHGLVIR